MAQVVEIRLRKDELIITLNEKCEYKEIQKALKKKIPELKKLYKEDKTPIFVTGKVLKNKEIEENHLIATTEYYDLKIDYDKTDIDEIDKKVETYIETQKNEFLKTVEDSKDIMDFRYDFILTAHTLE